MSVQAVILDWAGTAIDCGCIAPVGVFREVFANEGVKVSMAHAREPMGTHKREHIRRMTLIPEIHASWSAEKGAAVTDVDIDRMYAAMAPLALKVLPRFSEPIPGVIDAIAAVRSRGIRVGSCTGYTRAMLDVVSDAAAKHGYRPDVAVASTEVSEGRPAPFLPREVAKRLGAWPAETCVVVGDTVPDVKSGRAAAMWAIGIAATGNAVGLNARALAALSAAERESRVSPAREALYDAGAHLVIDSVADLPAAVAWVEGQQRRQTRP